MIARFHTLHVPMAGIDVHQIEKAPKPCIVACPFDWDFNNNDKFSKTVTGHTYRMVQREYSLGLVPHATEVGTYAGAAELAAVVLTSSSKAAMGIASVSSERRALATSMLDHAGLNLNCQNPNSQSIKLPTGVTISEFPLFTNPTDDDWVDFVITWGWDTAFSWALGRAVPRGKIPEPYRATIKKFVSDHLKPLIERQLKRINEEMKLVTTADDAQIFDTVLD